ncbi:MAG: hypothetical protein ACRD2O_17100 [Terriglobia bacterium]
MDFLKRLFPRHACCHSRASGNPVIQAIGTISGAATVIPAEAGIQSANRAGSHGTTLGYVAETSGFT